jgi:hypothetical protein
VAVFFTGLTVGWVQDSTQKVQGYLLQGSFLQGHLLQRYLLQGCFLQGCFLQGYLARPVCPT